MRIGCCGVQSITWNGPSWALDERMRNQAAFGMREGEPVQTGRAGTPSVSIIVPMLDEREMLPGLLQHLHPYRQAGCEVLLIDGGSQDGSDEFARRAGFMVVPSVTGRASQMNAGARLASGDLLVFLHADTRLPSGADTLVRHAIADESHAWGFFKIRIEGESRLLPIVGLLMNHRARLTGIATGDQAIFVRRSAFERVGGFPEQLLMEDIELSKRLKRIARPARVRRYAMTSGRRWESRGVLRTIALMWGLRLAYWLGASPETLARRYR
jgi:rSAM/selenodomain-associated transferase 2